MKITGNIWAKKIKEEHPGSIKGQFSEMVTYHEKRGKLKVTLTASEFFVILLDADNGYTKLLQEAAEECDYPDLLGNLEPSDIEVEITNA